MICSNCGKEISNEAKFCESCGAKQGKPITIVGTSETAPDKRCEEKSFQGNEVTENITLCRDGKYRWVYELNMLKNPVILLTVLKIIGIVFLVIFAFLFLIELFDGTSPVEFFQNVADGFMDNPSIPITVILILIGVIILSYFIVGAQYGWKYCVLFEMDDEGVKHIMMPRQIQKKNLLADIGILAGILAGSPSVIGSNMMAKAKNSSFSSFAHVKKVKVLRRFHTIKVNEPLEKNQVYAETKDFDFILNFIRDHVSEDIRKRM